MSPKRAAAPAAATYAPPLDLDAIARRRIVEELDVNMLVEAGAGSGKTTSLVGRMLALVARGTPVERIAAVTFTRKAANELRERFQIELERRVRQAAGTEDAAVFDRALREMDRCFLGTIHSFCGRLIRERPLEIALDPGFQEVTAEDWEELTLAFWRRWLERTKQSGDPRWTALAALGVDPRGLERAFRTVVLYPDVEFALEETPAPDVAPCRARLEALLAEARRLMPRVEPEDGWDELMSLVRRLGFLRQVHDWRDAATFCADVESIAKSSCKVTQKRWGESKDAKAKAKALCEEWTSFVEGDPSAGSGESLAGLLRRWREHRYPAVMRFLIDAAREFERERHATGSLGFDDLLLLAARLLREHPRVRAELGARWAHLLVDEFQDTDPVQAEVCFLLAAEPGAERDWRRVTPRPGALFVVGDPKQSIYRFRRADIQVYDAVRARMEASGGAVLRLTRNFRSVTPIGALVDRHFGAPEVFPAVASDVQAGFSPMVTSREAAGRDGVWHYAVHPAENRKKSAIVDADAALVASHIAGRIERGESAPGDFLILTATRAPIEAYARALAERNVPVATAGAPLPQEHELHELLVVLRAVADPENAVAVAAALEGLFFGLSPADLYDAREAGLRFAITHPPAASGASSPAGRALAALHGWWTVSQRHAADVLVERILDETGLLAHAAGQALGDARAGALLHLVEVLRAASVAGASGITEAMERIEILLDSEAADAPLRPGRADAVRVMNLHKAKGLEGEVVILAAPQDDAEHEPAVHVRREASGSAGWMVVEAAGFRGHTRVVAQPAGWERWREAERTFARAERDRLRYVAATRAKRELLIARCVRVLTSGRRPDQSMWAPLAATIDAAAEGGTPLAAELLMAAADAPGRRRAGREAADVERAVAEAVARVESAARPTLRIATVTESVKEERETRRSYDLPDETGEGAAWGRAVHRALEALGRGRSGASLAAFLSAVVRDEGLGGERAGDLASLVGVVERSAAWCALAGAGTALFEVPVMARASAGGVDTITEGVIDAASLGADGWTAVDWKSDQVDEPAWRARRAQYEQQVAAYASLLESLTGRPARAAIERVRAAD